jgi:hypothetical protein
MRGRRKAQRWELVDWLPRSPTISYSAYLGRAVQHLYRQAVADE